MKSVKCTLFFAFELVPFRLFNVGMQDSVFLFISLSVSLLDSLSLSPLSLSPPPPSSLLLQTYFADSERATLGSKSLNASSNHMNSEIDSSTATNGN